MPFNRSELHKKKIRTGPLSRKWTPAIIFCILIRIYERYAVEHTQPAIPIFAIR